MDDIHPLFVPNEVDWNHFLGMDETRIQKPEHIVVLSPDDVWDIK